MALSVGLLGTGRLGSAIRAAAASQDDVEVVWAVGRGTSLDGLAPVDVAVDVSSADAVAGHLAWARSTGTPLVVGTTGWDPALVPADVDLPVLVAPNFSLGVALVEQLARALGRYAAHTPSPVDLAVTDTHHRHKVDAPSGTAVLLREALAEGADADAGQVQTTSLRVGEVVGRHEVVAASALETITLAHEAHDRAVFATGALTAARWLVGRPAGRWSMADLAAEHLTTLTTPTTPGAPAPDAAA
ncbi:4-hydroxy-tetrahydrodipicolinate reductase [Ornithinimicrobium kibberense]|uniref:4-hydroxy-tetrahydrodipicolinate reductase n=1 Tax=Ornithinimicrobium kibberense TaxID=282060 RepID=A0ABV5V6F8_9MICO|nr:dihydrodipicolinate reductase C-terminal domain-containing protein [Ornithinimicrobium kibberense]